MAITRSVFFEVPFCGDGSSATFNVDLLRDIEAIVVLPLLPTILCGAVVSAQTGGPTLSITSSSLSGTVVSVTFNSAPLTPATGSYSGSIRISLGF